MGVVEKKVVVAVVNTTIYFISYHTISGRLVVAIRDLMD
jgi:hypothetical protein